MDRSQQLKTIKFIGIVLAIVLLIDLIVHYKAMKNTPQIPIPSVIVQKPVLAKVVEYITQTGNTVAFNSVNLVARVEGFLDTISFTDGTFVKKGAPLFVIEPKPYLEQLLSAKATVEAQKADLLYSKSEYARQTRMFKENATSKNNVEIWLAKRQEAEANLEKAIASATNAEITYGYTHITAPFDGRMGRHLVDIGNLVGNGVATNLATIEQIDPLYVYFNLNELDLIKLRSAARAQGYKSENLKKIPVNVRLQSDSGFNYAGKLDFVNTGLNASTGTMEFRALLPNKDLQLVPGLFVQVRVAITKPTPQLTVPDTAVLHDQIGAYLLVVNAQNIVELRRVTQGSLDGESRAIIKGLNAHDNVIIDGLQNATPGNQVAPQDKKNVE